MKLTTTTLLLIHSCLELHLKETDRNFMERVFIPGTKSKLDICRFLLSNCHTSLKSKSFFIYFLYTRVLARFSHFFLEFCYSGKQLSFKVI